MSRVFLSYAREDGAVARTIFDWLNRNGWNGDVFLDDHPEFGIQGGRAWRDALRTAAERCEAVIILISRSWLASPMCWSEFELAERFRKAILPIVLEADLDYADIPGRITDWYQLVDRARSTEEEFHLRLTTALARMGTGPESFALPEDAHPYPGLGALGEDEAALFFGRDIEVMQTTEILRDIRATGRQRMLVILGASGSGKSSLLRAGLWPRLRRDDRNFLVLPVIRPRDAVLSGESGLWRALAQALADKRLVRHLAPDTPRTAAAVARAVGDDPAALEALLAALRQAALRAQLDTGETPPEVILSVDQAEELFNTDAGAEADRFLALIGPLLAGGHRLAAVLTMRSDMIPRLQTDPRISQSALRLFNLPPMPATSLPRVIEGPAARLGLKVDPLLTGALLTDSRGADALPLLAFTLRVMHDGRLQHDRLTLADYEAMGGVRRAIEATAAKARAACLAAGITAADHDRLLQRGFVPHLVRINETGQPARRVARWAEIDPACHPVLRHLVDQRLLVTGADGSEPTVEIAHEAVLREWSDVAALVAQHRDWLAWREQITRHESDYRAGRGDLLSGRALAIALGFVEEHGPDVAPDIRAYVAASQAAAETERATREAERDRARKIALDAAEARARDARRSSRRLGVLAAALVLLALGLGYSVLMADRARATAELATQEADTARVEIAYRAQLAESLRVAGLAQDVIDTVSLPAGRAIAWLTLPHDADLAERPVTDEAATAIHRSGAEVIFDEAAALHLVQAPQGPFLALADATGARLRLLNTVTGRIVADRPMRGWKAWSDWDTAFSNDRPGAGTLPLPVFAPSGQTLTVVHGDGTAELWSTRDGSVLATARHAPDDARVIISHQGSRLLRQTADGRLIVVSLASDRPDLVLDRVIGPRDPGDFDSPRLDGLREHPEDRLVWVIDRTGRGYPEYTAFDGTTGGLVMKVSALGNDDVLSIDPVFGTRLVVCGTNNSAALLEIGGGSPLPPTDTPDLRDIRATVDGIVARPGGAGRDDDFDDDMEGRGGECAVSGDGLQAVLNFGDGIALLDMASGTFRDLTGLLPRFLTDSTMIFGQLQDTTRRRFGPVGLNRDGSVVYGVIGSESPTGDRALVFHDTRSGALVQRIDPGATLVDAIADTDTRTALIETADGAIGVWDVASGVKLHDLRPARPPGDGEGEADYADVLLEPSGNSVAVRSDTRLIVYRLRPDAAIGVSATPAARGSRDSYRAGLADGARDGVLLGTSGGMVERRGADGALLGSVRVAGAAIVRMAAFADGVAVAAWDGSLAVLDAEGLAVSAQVTAHDAPVSALGVAPGGRVLATGAQDGTLALWPDGPGGAALRPAGHEMTVADLVFSADGRALVSAGYDGRILVHDAATGAELAKVSGPGAPVWRLLALPGSDRIVAATGEGGLMAWDQAGAAAPPAPAWTIDLGSRVRSLAADPAGRFLAIGLEDGRLLLHPDPATGAPPQAGWIPALDGHRSAIVGLAFLAEGRLLVSLSRDRSLRLWDIETARQLGVWKGAGDTPVALVTGKDGLLSAVLYLDSLAEIRRLPGKTLRDAIADIGRLLEGGPVVPRALCDQLRLAELALTATARVCAPT